MNKDAKVLLIALVIIVIGAFSFNYTDMTGKITNDYTTITVSPKVVKAGESINIDISPGKQGVYSEIEFYRVGENDIRLGEYTPEICGDDRCSCTSNKCYEETTFDYKLLDNWDNNNEWDYTTNSMTYYARVYDVYSGTYKIAYFTVERAYPAAGLRAHP